MSNVLAREVVLPSREALVRSASIGLFGGIAVAGLTLGGAALACFPGYQPRVEAPPIAVPIAIATPVAVPLLVQPELPPEPAKPAPTAAARDFGFVFSAGDSAYMKLADVDGQTMPRHDQPRKLRGDDDDSYSATVIAEVRGQDVPAEHARWTDRRVVVDGGCVASITGFAIVSRLVGDIGYYGSDSEVESPDENGWDANTAFDAGHPVLAARLDGCTGLYARDADLPAILSAIEIEDGGLAAAARDAFLASELAASAQIKWAQAGGQGEWNDENAHLAIQVVRHPRTGERWVSVYARVAEGCGGPDINMWGLYRVGARRQLTAVQLREMGEIYGVQRLIDVDDDGMFEIVSGDWLGFDLVLARADGQELSRLSLPFYGCPC